MIDSSARASVLLGPLARAQLHGRRRRLSIRGLPCRSARIFFRAVALAEEAQRVTYAGLLKKHGLVNDSNKVRSESQKGRPKDKLAERVTHGESHFASKPTTAQKVTETTGMSRQIFTRHVSRAKLGSRSCSH
jgi:hypothetical protein